jgi:hypothetical protein
MRTINRNPLEFLRSLIPSDPAPHVPDDSWECMFLGRAYNLIARTIWGDSWTGCEPTTVLPELLPDVIQSPRNVLFRVAADEQTETAHWYEPPRRFHLDLALELLHTQRPDVLPRSMGYLAGSDIRFPPTFTVYQWKIAQGLNRDEYEVARQALQRKRKVEKAIGHLCEEGTLQTKLRPQAGGDFSDVLPHFWRTEDYGERFTKWRMHSQNPFVHGNAESELQLIFVTKSSLARALQKIQTVKSIEPQAVQSAYVSDQISFMLQVAAACGITDKNPQCKAFIE